MKLYDMVGTEHCCWVKKEHFTYETNPLSKACINDGDGNTYFFGGFWGGKREKILEMCKINYDNIEEDLKNNIIAIWHDESHINRYFYDNPPEITLSCHYMIFPWMDKSEENRIFIVSKNNDDIRS